MAGQLPLSLDATPPGTYRRRGVSSPQRLFRAHFAELLARYEAEFAKRLGKLRLERISKAVDRFLGCGEYMNEQLLLRLPHKQFVFTLWSGRCTDLPKVLRVPRASAAPQGLREPSSATTRGSTEKSAASSAWAHRNTPKLPISP